MWSILKATYFWQALQCYLETAAPMPITCFLRMQLQTPQDMTLEELGRVFVEQDSVALMTNVCFVLSVMPACSVRCVQHTSKHRSRTHMPMAVRCVQVKVVISDA